VSRAPKHSPYRTAREIVDLIVAEKLKNRKVRDVVAYIALLYLFSFL